MASSVSGQGPDAPPRIDDLVHEIEQLRAEKEQLNQAVITPEDGFTVLREVSQRTNTKLSSIAEQIVKHAQGAALPEIVLTELRAALARGA